MSNYTVDFRHEDRTGHNVTRQDKNALHIALHVTQKCVTHLLLSCVTHQLNNLISVDLLIFTVTTQVGMPYSYYDETIAA